MKKILFIVGSLRKNGFNEQLAKKTEELIGDDAQVEYLDWSKVPFFNQDLEANLPVEVQEVKDKVRESDALWIFTPEYNHQIPGPLKNLLDWLSRGAPSVLKDKKVTFAAAGGGSGGASVRDFMMLLLNQMMMDTMSMPNTGIQIPMTAFQTGQLEIESYPLNQLKRQVKAFLDYIA
ncbi:MULTISPECIES: NADPH-dependent FMN reductase [Faecalicoccus]|uniref:NAD(P)H-dependent oxidoreductase n=1 Tax=Faecalicoccus pleomorphus TaxID=1323 RepID=A0AAW6CSK8_9FIRM|nr:MULTISPECIES: NADPH-dependent FMN reductase [Faecalicoccus]MCI6380130.1 NAD(P)H-dependent oxidoreductase [Erysipelotrichaceae bacterium]MDD7406543.1 NAD(P)H-dependent oxidoreductase [Lactobacillus amylovorus]MDB7979694.1 NAD(P)H-dependent oxidoreductase [Faecalicoccus pleomorphus]MDB7981911.1 NAD(P)H-dependent oxidoreductase [Faecalicoccus pleomorphus]MDB7988923.1 NAD(P)H-dependent oxidoreductase [Faecalicoccus pleomorphus]